MTKGNGLLLAKPSTLCTVSFPEQNIFQWRVTVETLILYFFDTAENAPL